jgi:hypothetical protein
MDLDDLQDELPELDDDLELDEAEEWDETEVLRDLREVVPQRDLDDLTL